MANFKPRRLQDIAPFHALGSIAECFGVDISLFGGAASRIAMYSFYRPNYNFDIFDLTPFTSDIDIAHSGTKEKTPEIMNAIRDSVPFADWCRWSLIDKEQSDMANLNRSSSTRVPLRSWMIGTDVASKPPQDAVEDLQARKISFVRNSTYSSSVLARSGLDLEIFGLLMALNTQADLNEIAEESETLVDTDSAMAWLNDPETGEQLAGLFNNPKLVSRLWNLIAPQIIKSSNKQSFFDTELKKIILSYQYLFGSSSDFYLPFGDSRSFAVSKFQPESGFRVPQLSPEFFTGAAAIDNLDQVLNGLHLDLPKRVEGDRKPSITIDPSFDIVGFVPHITIKTSIGEKSEEGSKGVYFSDSTQDFFHFSWDEKSKIGDHRNSSGLTASIIPWTRSHSTQIQVPAAVGGGYSKGREWIRIDLASTIEKGRDAKNVEASLLILRARDSNEK